MSIDGPTALRSIEEALRDIRREESEIVRRLARSAELIAKLRAQEGELFRQLAALRLDPAARAALASELGAAEVATAQMLDAHERRLAETEAQLDNLDAAIVAACADRAALRIDAARRTAELDALAAKARPKLGTDPGYAAKLTAARELATVAEQSLRHTARADTDREYNGRPYREDPLFMYLWERGFGTGSYRVNALSAWLDGKVAKLIGYADAKANFLRLNEIPLRLRDHAERQQEKARAAAAEIAAIESIAVDSAGGRGARDAITALQARIGALDREVVALQDQRDEAIKAQRELAQGTGDAFMAALDGLSDVLDRTDVKTLLANARATPKGQDITMVQQIDELRQRGKDEGEEARGQRSHLRTLAARRRDLEDIQYEIKAQGFDNPRASFADDRLAGEMLNDFVRGAMSVAVYWERWRQAYSSADTKAGARPSRGAGSGLSRPRGVTAKPEALTSAA